MEQEFLHWCEILSSHGNEEDANDDDDVLLGFDAM
jgi:hypothetical protein